MVRSGDRLYKEERAANTSFERAVVSTLMRRMLKEEHSIYGSPVDGMSVRTCQNFERRMCRKILADRSVEAHVGGLSSACIVKNW